MTIAKFTTEIKRRGVAKASHYSIEFSIPSFMNVISDNLEMVQMFCESTQLPEFVLMTSPIKDDGNTREVVYDKIYPPIMCSFICDQDMIVKRFFDKWVQGAVKEVGGVFRYPDSYVIPELVIYQLNEKREVVYRVRLKGVYPKLVSDIPLSAASKDYNRVQVQFVYRSWESEATADIVEFQPGGKNNSIFDYINQMNDALRAVESGTRAVKKIGGIPSAAKTVIGSTKDRIGSVAKNAVGSVKNGFGR